MAITIKPDGRVVLQGESVYPLPSALGRDGHTWRVKNLGPPSVAISAPSGQTVDDVAVVVLAAGKKASFTSDGASNWDMLTGGEDAASSGTQGPPGPQGPQGASGPEGAPGAQGVPGPKGDAGADGARGGDGAPGTQGPQGSVGPAGADGAAGAQGTQGPQGVAGNDGATGSQGPQGNPGAPGAKGDTGATGPQGPAVSFPVAGAITSSGGGIGYAAGAGGTVTQLTSRSTTVVLNKLCGNITMFSAAQAAQALVTFTLTNSFIEATDVLVVQHISATGGGAWNFSTVCGSGSATISIKNVSNASITSATPLRFMLLKGATS